MSKSINNIEEINGLFDILEDDVDRIVFKNPVLNGMFNDGLNIGSVVQIAAESGTGKSTLALEIARELCEQKYKVAYIDTEGGINSNMLDTMRLNPYVYSKKTNPEGLFFVFRDNDCGGVNILVQQLSNNHLADIIIIDSLGALDSGLYKEDGTDANTPKVGGDSKSLKILLKTINGLAISKDTKTTFICINHTAKSIGTYVPVEAPVGGQASIYLSDVVILLNKVSSEFAKTNLGQKVQYKAIKSRFGYGNTKVPFYILYGKGICLPLTYREVIEEIPVTFNDEPHKLVEMRGGGNGSMYINNQEFKFRGENQLLKLIGDNFVTISKLIPKDAFKVKQPEIPDYLKTSIKDNSYQEVLPKDLQSFDVVKTDNTNNKLKIYFLDGVDSTGQVYSVYYNESDSSLYTEYDSEISTEKNPTKKQVNTSIKNVNNYLKELSKA